MSTTTIHAFADHVPQLATIDARSLAGVTGGKENGDKGFDVNRMVDNGNRWAAAGGAVGGGIGLAVGGPAGAGAGAAAGGALGWVGGAMSDAQDQLGIKPDPKARRVARFGR